MSTTIVPLSWYQRLTVRSLFWKSLSDRRVMTLLIGFGIGLMTVLVASMFPSLQDTLEEFDLGPAFDSFIGGAGMSTPEGWLSAEVFSILAPGAIAALAIVDSARSLASEMEDLSIGLLTSNPISRVRVIVDKSIAIVIHVVVASALIGLFTWLSIVVVGLEMEPTHALAASLHLGVLGIMVAGTGVLFSVLTGKRITTMITVGSIVFVAYMVSVLLPISTDLAQWAKLSPWYYYWADNPLVNGVNWADLGVMAFIALAMFALAVAAFTRKDLQA